MKRLTLALAAAGAFLMLARAGAEPTTKPAPAAPAASGPLAVLDADRAALKSLVMVADIETPKSGNRWSKFPMNFEYAAPNKYRSEIKTGGFEGDLIAVADGEFIWSYPTKTKKVTKIQQALVVESIKENGPNDLLTVLATPTLTFTSLFNLKGSSTDSGLPVLEVTPKISVKDYDKIMLTTSADGKTPVFAVAWKGAKIIARVSFTKYERNAAVSADHFVFTVPAGVTLIEK